MIGKPFYLSHLRGAAGVFLRRHAPHVRDEPVLSFDSTVHGSNRSVTFINSEVTWNSPEAFNRNSRWCHDDTGGGAYGAMLFHARRHGAACTVSINPVKKHGLTSVLSSDEDLPERSVFGGE